MRSTSETEMVGSLSRSACAMPSLRLGLGFGVSGSGFWVWDVIRVKRHLMNCAECLEGCSSELNTSHASAVSEARMFVALPSRRP